MLVGIYRWIIQSLGDGWRFLAPVIEIKSQLGRGMASVWCWSRDLEHVTIYRTMNAVASGNYGQLEDRITCRINSSNCDGILR